VLAIVCDRTEAVRRTAAYSLWRNANPGSRLSYSAPRRAPLQATRL